MVVELEIEYIIVAEFRLHIARVGILQTKTEPSRHQTRLNQILHVIPASLGNQSTLHALSKRLDLTS